MQIQELDFILVPLGVLILGIYHVWLLYTIIRYPSRTVIGLNAQSRYQWVLSLMNSIRYYAQASFLISTPALKGKKDLIEYVAKTLDRGSYAWSLGLRAFYVSIPLILWIYGPIPMFACCCLTPFTLYFLDTTAKITRELHSNSFKKDRGTHDVESVVEPDYHPLAGDNLA